MEVVRTGQTLGIFGGESREELLLGCIRGRKEREDSETIILDLGV